MEYYKCDQHVDLHQIDQCHIGHYHSQPSVITHWPLLFALHQHFTVQLHGQMSKFAPAVYPHLLHKWILVIFAAVILLMS